MQNLAVILQWFQQLRELVHSDALWLQCEIALVEMFTNAVRHAHRNRPQDTPVEVRVCVGTNAMEIQVWDRGEPFDLQDYLDKLPDTVDRNQEGGRGLKIIQEVADVLSYKRHSDRNCFSMIRYLTS